MWIIRRLTDRCQSTLQNWINGFVLICNQQTTQPRVDETYIKVKGAWKCLYRAVDYFANTFSFMLSAKWNARAAQWFCRRTLKVIHPQTPRVINVDKNAAYPSAVDDLKADEQLPKTTELRQVKYLNNQVEQDYQFIKHLVKPDMGFGSFNTARRTLRGIKAMNMIRKGQVQGIEKGDVRSHIEFVSQIFRVFA